MTPVIRCSRICGNAIGERSLVPSASISVGWTVNLAALRARLGGPLAT